MTLAELVRTKNRLIGSTVVIDAYLGHACEGQKIDRGEYEPTWLAGDVAGAENQLRIELSPSEMYPRPFRFHEMIHASRAGGIRSEVTEEDPVRFCGRLMLSSSPRYIASLVDLQWCELPMFAPRWEADITGSWTKGSGIWRFIWRFTIGRRTPMPNPGTTLSDFLLRNSNGRVERVRVSGVAVILGTAQCPPHSAHIVTDSVGTEHTRERCAVLSLAQKRVLLPGLMIDVDLGDRVPDYRIWRCILEGSYQPEASASSVGRFHKLRELTILPALRPTRSPGELSQDIRFSIQCPRELLDSP